MHASTLRSLITLSLVVSLPAMAGPISRPPGWQPSLADQAADEITVEQALKGAQTFLLALGSTGPSSASQSIAIPYAQYLGGGTPPSTGDDGCLGRLRYVDEAEGLPGAPSCLQRNMAAFTSAFVALLAPPRVFPTLAALEAKDGRLEGPARALLAPLQHHRLIALRLSSPIGPVRLVLALRRSQEGARVDALSAQLPAAPKR